MKPDPTRNTRAALTELMTAHKLTRADVARLLGLPVKNYTHSSVQSWIAGKRNMPPSKLELLRLKLSSAPTAPAHSAAADPQSHSSRR